MLLYALIVNTIIFVNIPFIQIHAMVYPQYCSYTFESLETLGKNCINLIQCCAARMLFQPTSQSNVSAKQNVSKISNVISSIDEADMSNVRKKITSTMFYSLQGAKYHRLTGKSRKKYLHSLPIYTLLIAQ